MKNHKFIILVLAIAVSIASCRKYVDIPRSSDMSSFQTANDCQLLLDNTDAMNSGYPNDAEASADDAYLTNSGFLATVIGDEEKALYTWAPDAIRSSAKDQWAPAYYAVYYANLVMEQVDKLKNGGTPAATLNTLRGSALFYRAFAFWQVAQAYAKPYVASTAATDIGIPLRLISDISAKSVRASVGDTYSRITGDLLEAVDLLPETSIVPTRPNKASVYAMLARVYLSMEDYTQALNYANQALALNNNLLDYSTLDPSSPFPQPFNKEVIFYAVTTSANVIVDPSGQGRINPDLYAMYDNNDLRKSLFFADAGDGSYQFTGNYSGQSKSAAQFDGLTVDELFLIRAECYARANKVTEALADLNTLLSNRWNSNGGATPYQNITAATADEALAKILVERRKELVMRNLRWTDLRRLNHDSRFAVTLTRTVQSQTYTLPPNDIRYTLLIPFNVIQYGGIQQNSR